MTKTVTNDERFWSKVNLLAPGGCWKWTANTINGYGKFWLGEGSKRHATAHRWAWERLVGEVPSGLDLDHINCSRDCVNPAHLRPVTRKQNMENQRSAHRNSKSGIRGVTPYRGRWMASVRHNGVKVHVGYFDTIHEAEAAVTAKRVELFTHNDADQLKVVG